MTVPDWLADPALVPVWQHLRGPLERGARTTRLTGLARPTRHALGRLLRRPVTGDVRLVLAELEPLIGRPVLEVVVALTGPLRDRPAELAARSAPLEVLAAVDPVWARAVRASGLLSRAPDAVQLATTAVAVLALLPGVTRLRTELAAAVAGDAHALDDGRPLAALVLRGLTGGPLPATATERRVGWEAAGVHADRVSTTVLTLGLRPIAGGPLVGAADRGDPVHLTPWDLRRYDLRVVGPVLVVENPSVLEAFAVQYGGAQAVVCTAGWPAHVAVELLDRLAAPLAYHGDLDWRGVEICSWLIARCGVRPWRMTTADYLAAPGGGPLSGRDVDTAWEPALAEAMRARGVAVHEEQVVAQLLDNWPASLRIG
ncbi:MAG: DUF2399 domain-containing protein [Pseudorhodobacter sp.]|nr:DUF2399 domain-containing protein [Frankiaceae bacterium]